MNAQPQGVHIPYEERNVRPEDFHKWIAAENHDRDRVQVITGSPGSGKSTFMNRLHTYLSDDWTGQPLLILWLDLAGICRDPSSCESALQEWLVKAQTTAKDRLQNLADLPPRMDARTQFEDFGGNLHAVCALTRTIVVLLIDGWDDVDPDPPLDQHTPHSRGEIEKIVGSFMRNPEFHVRCVVACRGDDYRFSILDAKKWRKPLTDLINPREYAERRLEALAGAGELTAPLIIELLDCRPEQADALVGRQGGRAIDQAAVLAAVQPLLCGNPYLINRMLYYALMGHDLQQTEYRNAIIMEYLQRVPLDNVQAYLELLYFIVQELNEKWLGSDLNDFLHAKRPDLADIFTIRPIQNAGIVVPDKGRFELDASLRHLLSAP